MGAIALTLFGYLFLYELAVFENMLSTLNDVPRRPGGKLSEAGSTNSVHLPGGGAVPQATEAPEIPTIATPVVRDAPRSVKRPLSMW